MSDYLGKLVARSLSPSAMVRPQLLSVFEPPGTNVVPEPGIVSAASAADEVTARPPGSDRMSQLESLWSPEPNVRAAGRIVPAPLETIQPETVQRFESHDTHADASGRTPAPAAGPPPVAADPSRHPRHARPRFVPCPAAMGAVGQGPRGGQATAGIGNSPARRRTISKCVCLWHIGVANGAGSPRRTKRVLD